MQTETSDYDYGYHQTQRTNGRRMSFWDRYEAEHREQFSNLPRNEAENEDKVRAAFIRGEITAYSDSHQQEEYGRESWRSASSTSVEYGAKESFRPPTRSFKTSQLNKKFLVKERRLDGSLNSQDEYYGEVCANISQTSSDAENDRNFTRGLFTERERDINLTLPQTARKPSFPKSRPGHWNVRQRPIDENFPAHKISSNPITSETDWSHSPTCSTGHRSHDDQSMAAGESENSESGSTFPDVRSFNNNKKIRVLYRSPPADFCSPQGSGGRPTGAPYNTRRPLSRAIRAESAQRSSFPPHQRSHQSREHRQAKRQPKYPTSVVQYLQGIPAASRRFVRFKDESENNNMIHLGRKRHQRNAKMTKKKFKTTRDSDDSSSGNFMTAARLRRFEESESTAAFSTDDERVHDDRPGVAKRKREVPWFTKWRGKIFPGSRRKSHQKSSALTRQDNNSILTETMNPSLLNCVMDNRNFNAAVNLTGQAFDAAVKFTAGLILLYYVSQAINITAW